MEKMIATIHFELECSKLTEEEMKKVLIEKMAYEMDEWIYGERIIEIEFETKKIKNENTNQPSRFVN
jgi:ethanolamine utilization protein EutQ (cupin superfamily)